MYGAKCDGVTDDTECFEKAINTNKTVVIPDGVYLISKPLIIQKSIIGIGLPEIKVNSNIEFIFKIENTTQIDIKNINFNNPSSNIAIYLNNVRNSRFENIRINNIHTGIYMENNCWANIFEKCTFYKCINGIKADGDSNNLATTIFNNCYFGSNTNCIFANSMSNCHFNGGWIEENENCFNIIPYYNMIQNTFTSVDFELNDLIIFADNTDSNTSVLWNFAFSKCSFICNANKRKLVKHISNQKYMYLNIVMDHSYTDFYFQNIPGQRIYLGLIGMNYRTAMHGGTDYTNYGYVYPCFVNGSGIDYKIPDDIKEIKNDGKSIKVTLPNYCFIHTIKINKQNVSGYRYGFSSFTTSKTNMNFTLSDDISQSNQETAMRQFVIESDENISDAEITINIADYSDII